MRNRSSQRNDIQVSDDAKLAAALESVIGARKTKAKQNKSFTWPAGEPDAVDVARREGFVEDDKHDPSGLERIIGESDLLSINFLDRGRRAARAVCIIETPMGSGMSSSGTGFLVAPRLLLTNNHVIPNSDVATQSYARFGFEHDIDGIEQRGVAFSFAPIELFYTSRECDFTLVGLVPLSSEGVPLDRYGWLPLLPGTGKALDGEWVTIIQHPEGRAKQIAIHASQMVRLDPKSYPDKFGRFTHYTTDTEPGSSGSPVLNDQWQVVALHHKAVPDAASIKHGTAPSRWIANEGVRVSSIFRQLEQDRFQFGDAGRALDRLARGIGLPPLAIASDDSGVTQGSTQFERQSAPLKADHWVLQNLGYNPAFLGAKGKIKLEPIYRKLAATGKVAPLLDGTHELKYFHYSSLMHAERRFPLFTVVNIDGKMLKHPGERKDTWRPDGRIDAKYQSDDDFYLNSKKYPPEAIYFSRGHLVRLLDPCWGDGVRDAERGMMDTFHFTNAAPQVQKYNDADWGNLEDYLLNLAQTTERKLTVFTGPVYRKDDPLWGHQRPGGPWRIPLSFWKVAVLKKSDDEYSAAAFHIGQSEYLDALYEAKVFTGLTPYSLDQLRDRKLQVTLKVVEDLTGLDFSQLRKWGAQGSLESTAHARWFDSLNDLII